MSKSSAEKIIVFKIGSSTLVDSSGKVDLPNLNRITKQLTNLIENRFKVIIVTSGAVALGTDRLKLKNRPKTIPEKQAAAAVGQSILMRQYEKAFEKYDIPVAQILITRDALENSERRANARQTITTLLKEGVVPVVNENDTVAVEEIRVGDNDNLSAMVAALVEADKLIMLSDIDGFYLKTDEGISYKADVINKITDEVIEAAGHPSTQLGTGGMVTKIQAAGVCLLAGIDMAIVDGKKADLAQVVTEQKIGTWFIPTATNRS